MAFRSCRCLGGPEIYLNSRGTSLDTECDPYRENSLAESLSRSGRPCKVHRPRLTAHEVGPVQTPFELWRLSPTDAAKTATRSSGKWVGASPLHWHPCQVQDGIGWVLCTKPCPDRHTDFRGPLLQVGHHLGAHPGQRYRNQGTRRGQLEMAARIGYRRMRIDLSLLRRLDPGHRLQTIRAIDPRRQPGLVFSTCPALAACPQQRPVLQPFKKRRQPP